MAHLTTFTIDNDGLNSILKNSDEFCKNLLNSALSGGKIRTFGHKEYANLVIVQKTRHTDNHTIYVHMGSTVSEMNACSQDTAELLKNHPKFFKKMLGYMKREVRRLEENLNVHSTKSNLQK